VAQTQSVFPKLDLITKELCQYHWPLQPTDIEHKMINLNPDRVAAHQAAYKSWLKSIINAPRISEIAVLCSTQAQSTLLNAHQRYKKIISCLLRTNVSLPIVDQIDTHRPVWNAYQLPPTTLIELLLLSENKQLSSWVYHKNIWNLYQNNLHAFVCCWAHPSNFFLLAVYVKTWC